MPRMLAACLDAADRACDSKNKKSVIGSLQIGKQHIISREELRFYVRAVAVVCSERRATDYQTGAKSVMIKVTLRRFVDSEVCRQAPYDASIPLRDLHPQSMCAVLNQSLA